MPEPSPPAGHLRVLYIAGGLVCVGIGVVGMLLPGLPGTPFLVVALWAFSRSSRRLHTWLYTHPRLGPVLQNWHGHRVVPRSVRWTAHLSMTASLVYLTFYSGLHWAVPAVTGVVCLVGVVFISRCPTEAPAPQPGVAPNAP